jgi:hypothetical protein
MKIIRFWWCLVLLAQVAAGPLPDATVPGEIAPSDPKQIVAETFRKMGSLDPAVRDAACGVFLDFAPRFKAEAVRQEAQANLDPAVKTLVDHLLSLREPLDQAIDDVQLRWQSTSACLLKLYTKAYEQGGFKNAKWDDDAHAGIGYSLEATTAREATVQKNFHRRSSFYLERAIASGCADPAVLLLSVLEGSELKSLPVQTQVDRLQQAIASDKKSGTIPFVRMKIDIALLRRVKQPDFAAGVASAVKEFKSAMTDKDFSPAIAAIDATDIDALALAGNLDRKQVLDSYEQDLETAFPNSGPILSHKGKFYVDYAWEARGGDVAARTTAQQFKDFEARLTIAKEALETSWDVDPHDASACVAMLKVELGLDGGRDEMERWFQRGLSVLPGDIKLYNQKMLYLQPKWHGTPEDVLKFGQECAKTELYRDAIPLEIAFAHEDIARVTQDPQAYMKQPAVWNDISSVYEKMLGYFPNRSIARLEYVKFALECSQFEKAKQQIQIIGPNPVGFSEKQKAELARYQQLAQQG